MLIGGFMRKIRELEEKIGYCFQDQELLKHALRHSSYVNEKHMKSMNVMKGWSFGRCGSGGGIQRIFIL